MRSSFGVSANLMSYPYTSTATSHTDQGVALDSYSNSSAVKKALHVPEWVSFMDADGTTTPNVGKSWMSWCRRGPMEVAAPPDFQKSSTWFLTHH